MPPIAHYRLPAALLALALSASPTLAQQRPARPAAPAGAPAEPATPDRTTAQYGDWALTCLRPQGARERLCEMSQAFQDANQQPVAVLAFGRPAKDARFRLVLRVPPNVRVAQPAKLTLESDTALPFTLCNRQFCLVELELPDDTLSRTMRLRAAEQPARLTWRDAAGTELSLTVSARGFAAAWEAMQREGS